ncbi:ribbon-helix-helix protein, CopG family [Glycomyces sp. YM15]|uniref:ribbon-helix-helix protein, CopG family n=1 Tax=Glycomyces sp. YM15 TaxID=2800446 RepID=UPI001963D6C8|nr:ribbon-helix-helix protein, CopG family [Glycomyces sp. YM15]
MARKKSTIYLDEKADLRLEAEARRRGIPKAELMRRFLDEGLLRAADEEPLPPLPKFSSGGPLTVEAMDEAIYQSIRRRSLKR